MKILSFLFVLLSLSYYSCQKPPANSSNEPSPAENLEKEEISAIVLTVGDISLNTDELTLALQNYNILDKSSLDSSIQDILFHKKAYQEALKKGYGLDENGKEELKSYQSILARDYILDSLTLEMLIDEAYTNLQKEVNASHIFLAFSEDQDPSDSLFIYNELIRIREKAIETNSFDSLAKIYSQDRKTAQNGGSLGWFGALQMFYPIEKVAFQMEKGTISFPIRSAVGFHLIRVNDTRPSQGTVTVRHILKAVPDWNDSSFVAVQKKAIDSLLIEIKNGKDFELVSNQNSDDKTSSSNGGILPSFSIGTRAEVEFEKVAFSLAENEVSPVTKSSVGYHIIQLVEKKTLESKESLYDFIKSKVTTDSRGDFLTSQTIAKAKDRLGYEINISTYLDIEQAVDNKLLNGTWKNQIPNLEEQSLLKIEGKDIPAKDFIEFITDRQTYDEAPQGYSSKMALRRYFKVYENNLIKSQAESKATEWNPSFAHQMQLLKENLVVNALMNDLVLEKSVADTSGQRRVYEQNLINYIKPARRFALSIKANNKSFLESVKEAFEEQKPYRLKRGIKPVYFTKNNFQLSDEEKIRLSGLAALLDKNPDYIVEVGGNADVAEDENISSARINSVVNYLRGLGVPITKINELDYQKTRLADRFDWTKNQRVSIQFFSNNELDLLPSLDPEKDYLMSIERKWFDHSNELVWKVPISESQVFELDENNFVLYHIINEQEAGYLTLREAKSKVIQDYQAQLKKELVGDFEIKYPTNINQEKLNELSEAIINKN